MKKILLLAALALTTVAQAQIPFTETFSGTPTFKTGYEQRCASGTITGCGSTVYDALFPENTYCISAHPSDKHANFSSINDHTTNNNGGRMLVVNGNSIQKSAPCLPLGTSTYDTVFSKTITGLTVGSTYTFEMYAVSVNPMNPAKLYLLIGGEALKLNGTNNKSYQLSSGTSQSDFTRIYGAFKALNTSVTINVFDSTLMANGNDFALDDISVKAGGTNLTPLPLTIRYFNYDNRLLRWEFSIVSNISRVELEKSQDGQNWDSYSTYYDVKTSFQYSEPVSNGLYRLRATDLSGAEGYSNIVRVYGTQSTNEEEVVVFNAQGVLLMQGMRSALNLPKNEVLFIKSATSVSKVYINQ